MFDARYTVAIFKIYFCFWLYPLQKSCINMKFCTEETCWNVLEFQFVFYWKNWRIVATSWTQNVLKYKLEFDYACTGPAVLLVSSLDSKVSNPSVDIIIDDILETLLWWLGILERSDVKADWKWSLRMLHGFVFDKLNGSTKLFSITTVDKVGISMESCLTDLSYTHICFPVLLQVARYVHIYLYCFHCYTCEFMVYNSY